MKDRIFIRVNARFWKMWREDRERMEHRGFRVEKNGSVTMSTERKRDWKLERQKFGPASPVRQLSDQERQAIEQRLRDEGKM